MAHLCNTVPGCVKNYLLGVLFLATFLSFCLAFQWLRKSSMPPAKRDIIILLFSAIQSFLGFVCYGIMDGLELKLAIRILKILQCVAISWIFILGISGPTRKSILNALCTIVTVYFVVVYIAIAFIWRPHGNVCREGSWLALSFSWLIMCLVVAAAGLLNLKEGLSRHYEVVGGDLGRISSSGNSGDPYQIIGKRAHTAETPSLMTDDCNNCNEDDGDWNQQTGLGRKDLRSSIMVLDLKDDEAELNPGFYGLGSYREPSQWKHLSDEGDKYPFDGTSVVSHDGLLSPIEASLAVKEILYSDQLIGKSRLPIKPIMGKLEDGQEMSECQYEENSCELTQGMDLLRFSSSVTTSAPNLHIRGKGGSQGDTSARELYVANDDSSSKSFDTLQQLNACTSSAYGVEPHRGALDSEEEHNATNTQRRDVFVREELYHGLPLHMSYRRFGNSNSSISGSSHSLNSMGSQSMYSSSIEDCNTQNLNNTQNPNRNSDGPTNCEPPLHPLPDVSMGQFQPTMTASLRSLQTEILSPFEDHSGHYTTNIELPSTSPASANVISSYTSFTNALYDSPSPPPPPDSTAPDAQVKLASNFTSDTVNDAKDESRIPLELITVQANQPSDAMEDTPLDLNKRKRLVVLIVLEAICAVMTVSWDIVLISFSKSSPNASCESFLKQSKNLEAFAYVTSRFFSSLLPHWVVLYVFYWVERHSYMPLRAHWDVNLYGAEEMHSNDY